MRGMGAIAKLDDKVYLEERRGLIEQEAEQSRSYDKAILTMTAGGLGLSLTFIKDIVPDFAACTSWLLYLGWALLVTSLLTTLCSFRASVQAFRRQRAILDRIQRGEGTHENSVNHVSRVTAWLNYASLVAFVGGAAAVTLFVALN